MPVAPPTPPMSDITVMIEAFGNVGTMVPAATCWASSPWNTEMARAMMPKNMMTPNRILWSRHLIVFAVLSSSYAETKDEAYRSTEPTRCQSEEPEATGTQGYDTRRSENGGSGSRICHQS